MLKSHHTNTMYDKKNAMKEVMQEITLCGLSRAGLFKKAAFYGDTALRIFHGLDRFSEDLDFSLITHDEDFELSFYFPTLKNEVNAYGLNVEIAEKKKTLESNIQSAFLKGNTKEHLLFFYPEEAVTGIIPNERIRIKFEVETNPPPYANFVHQYRLLPAPYEVRLYDLPSLFAGKIHAVICRAWGNQVKGRDLYDFIFYLTKHPKVNLSHLKARLIQSGHIADQSPFSLDDLKQMLFQRFDRIDYELAKLDVLPFIRDQAMLDLWSSAFFKQITIDYLETT